MWSSVVGGRFVSFGLTAKGQRGFVSVPIPRRFTWGEVHRGARGFLNCPPGVVTVAPDDEGSLGGRCLVSLNDQWSVAGARGAKRCTVMVVIPPTYGKLPGARPFRGHAPKPRLFSRDLVVVRSTPCVPQRVSRRTTARHAGNVASITGVVTSRGFVHPSRESPNPPR